MAEVERTYYESGKLESEVFTIDGKKNGFYKQFDKYGTLMIEATYVDDKLNGEYRQNMIYHDLYIISLYIDNKLNGPHKLYNRNGDFLGEFLDIDGWNMKNVNNII